jgi:hypothetical protein
MNGHKPKCAGVDQHELVGPNMNSCKPNLAGVDQNEPSAKQNELEQMKMNQHELK